MDGQVAVAAADAGDKSKPQHDGSWTIQSQISQRGHESQKLDELRLNRLTARNRRQRVSAKIGSTADTDFLRSVGLEISRRKEYEAVASAM